MRGRRGEAEGRTLRSSAAASPTSVPLVVALVVADCAMPMPELRVSLLRMLFDSSDG